MFLMTQACVKPMIEQGKKGSVINICSTYGLNGPDQRIYVKDGRRVAFKPVYYTVTKAGVMGFTKYLAAYYAGTEIRANCMVTRVDLGPDGRARSVNYVRLDEDGNRYEEEQAGEVIILACYSIETPRLLLNSAQAGYPNGLANSNGLVGKGLKSS